MRLAGATMATQSTPNVNSYPWEKVYTAAVLDADNASLEQPISVAEEALLIRWLEMTSRHEHRVEIQAIMDALIALRNQKRERLRDKSKPL